MATGIIRGASAAPVKTGSFQKTHYLSLNPGESTYLRFLTDYEYVTDPDTKEESGGILFFMQHYNVPTLPAPPKFEGEWPSKMSAVCRRENAYFAEKYHGECYICDVIAPTKPAKGSDAVQNRGRQWGLAVLREPKKDENGRDIPGQFQDKTREVTIKGKDGKADETIVEKAIIALNFGAKNFWNNVSGMYQAYGTLLDRDYLVKREGTGLETDYRFAPMDKIVKGDVVFDLRVDAFMAKYLPEAEQIGYAAASDKAILPIIEQQASDSFFGRFFDPDLRSAAAASTDSTPTPAVRAEVEQTQARADGLMDRLRSGAPASAEAAPEPAPSSGPVSAADFD